MSSTVFWSLIDKRGLVKIGRNVWRWEEMMEAGRERESLTS